MALECENSLTVEELSVDIAMLIIIVKVKNVTFSASTAKAFILRIVWITKTNLIKIWSVPCSSNRHFGSKKKKPLFV